MSEEIKPTFEERYSEISEIVEKLRPKWTFKASVMEDFDDVKSKIIIHIWEKWHLYDPKRSLGAWVATVAKHRFSNILRDTYKSTTSPCSRCPSNKGENLCALYGEQCVECPLYKKWYNNKRHAHNARLPVSLENHQNEVHQYPDTIINLENAIGNLHERMKEVLTKSEWDIYVRLNIQNKSEEQTAEELGFKTTEQGRKMGYKRIRQVKTVIYKQAKKILSEHGIETLA